MRGVTFVASSFGSLSTIFQLTRLMRGVTKELFYMGRSNVVFQLTRLMRGVTPYSACIASITLFQLTRLMRGVTGFVKPFFLFSSISTHTPHARRDSTGKIYLKLLVISTHTPHARRDSSFYLTQDSGNEISTHTPHARRDKGRCEKMNDCIEFQLTRLMRGVTTHTVNGIYQARDFNSHASCEA